MPHVVSVEYVSSSDLDLALCLVDQADAVSSQRFGNDVEVARKPDGSLVTDADREIEALLVEGIRRNRPADGIVGEEDSKRVSLARRCWFIDPIDGTGHFVAGRSTWGTLMALVVDGQPVLGVASAPALDRRWWAESTVGSWCKRLSTPDSDQPLHVSYPSQDHQPTIGVIGHRPSQELLAAVSEVGRVDDTGLGPLDVAAGRLDMALVVTAPFKPWNLASFVAIVETAGGDFSDINSGADLNSDVGIFTNRCDPGSFHEAVARVATRR